jgi:hypothetical protein
MLDRQLVLRRPQDQRGDAGDLPPAGRNQLEPVELAYVGDHVEHAAPADVDGHRAELGYVDDGVEMGRERGHVLEGDLLDLAGAALGRDADEARGSLQGELGHRFHHGDHARLQEHGCHGDRVAAAHDGVLDLLHDDEARRGIRMLGRNDQVAAQGWVAPRLAQHQHPELVVVLLEPLHLLVDRAARNARDAARDDAHRLAGVCLDRVDHPPEGHARDLLF